MQLKKWWLGLLCIVCLLCGCTGQVIDQTTKMELNERQQELADGIWRSRSLWNGCVQLSLHKVTRSSGNEYYLSANYLVSSSSVRDVFGTGKNTTVATYKAYTYRIVDGRVVDDMTLGEDGILAGSQLLGRISFSDMDTDEEMKNRITHLVSKY